MATPHGAEPLAVPVRIVLVLAVLSASAVGAAVLPAPHNDLAPAERTFRFNFRHATYAEILDAFAAQSGLPIEGPVPEGRTTFDTGREEMSYDLAFNRLSMLLFNHPDQYWLKPAHDAEYVRVHRMADTRSHLPLDHMFATLQRFEESYLPDHDLVLVLVTPDAPIETLPDIAAWLPGYVRITQFTEQNSFTVFATQRDVRHYLPLVNMLDDATTDGDFQLVERCFQNIEPYSAVEALLAEFGAVQVYDASRLRIVGLPTTCIPHVRVWTDWAHQRVIVAAPQGQAQEVASLLTSLDPPENRTYRFNLRNAPFSEILAEFARQSGMAIEGDIRRVTRIFDTGNENASLDLTLGRLAMVVSSHPWPACREYKRNAQMGVLNLESLCRRPAQEHWHFSWEDFARAHEPEGQIVHVHYAHPAGQPDTVVLNRILPTHVQYYLALDSQDSLILHGTAHDVWHYLPLLKLLGDTLDEETPAEFILLFEGLDATAALDTLREHFNPVRHYNGRLIAAVNQRPHQSPVRIWTDPPHQRAVVACPESRSDEIIQLLGQPSQVP